MVKDKYIISFLLILQFFIYTEKSYPNQWEIKKNSDGVKVYTRNVANSNYKEFKATTIVHSSNKAILKILEDVDNYGKWLPNLKSSKLLKIPAKGVYIIYQCLDLPWPVKDRDYIYKAFVNNDNSGNKVEINFALVPDYLAEKKNTIRIKKMKAVWHLLENPKNNTVEITYQQHSEPGGDLPSWMANSHVTERPFLLLKNLAKLAELK